MRDRLPRPFGGYLLRQEIARGGMGRIFLAKKVGIEGFEQHLCIKMIRSSKARDRSFLEHFFEEARIVARLRHDSIIQILDFGEHEGIYYIALELVDGTDLRTLLRRFVDDGQHIPLSLLSYIAIKLTSALEVAHAAGVIHRDLSPENVLLGRGGEVKLTDFGVAKADSALRDPTRPGIIKGKPLYMAPEYAKSAACDARADLFSMGVLLYEGLTDTCPFEGDHDLEVLTRLLRGEYRPLEEARPGLPAAWYKIVGRLLRASPAERYPDAEALLDALTEVAPPMTAVRELGQWVRRVRPEPLLSSTERALAGDPRAGERSGSPSGPRITARSPGKIELGKIEPGKIEPGKIEPGKIAPPPLPAHALVDARASRGAQTTSAAKKSVPPRRHPSHLATAASLSTPPPRSEEPEGEQEEEDDDEVGNVTLRQEAPAKEAPEGRRYDDTWEDLNEEGALPAGYIESLLREQKRKKEEG